ncbi:MAG: DNA internalization-related competence protein ComEC/Rec2 [Acidobacteria bacterium]|nr:MAG: DNA internalization-related competence protein ComEC/Rec2 [Acidobacteriota bacterium]
MLAPVAALVAGATVGGPATAVSIPLVTVLLALGLTLRRGAGWNVAALALGLLGAATDGGRLPTDRHLFPDQQRPVTLVGHLAGHWSEHQERLSVPLRVETLRQGTRVESWPMTISLSLPAGEPPPAGYRFRVRGYVRRSAGFANHPPVPAGRWRLWVKSRVLIEPEPGSRDIELLVDRMQWLRRRLDEALRTGSGTRPGAIITRTLVLGERWATPVSWRRALRRAGMSHLLALSGLHVGLLVGISLVVGAGLPPGGRFAVVGVAVVLYLLVAGPRPSLLRASAMVLVAWTSLRLERPPVAANLLPLVAGGMVLIEPGLPRDLGFCLTVAATAGIIHLAPIFARRWTVLPDRLRLPLATTVAAQLATMPWALPAFHLVTPLAPLWNLLAIPWTALTLTGCLIWSCVALILPPVGRLVLPLLDLLAWPYAALGSITPARTLAWPLHLSPPAATLLAVAVGAICLQPKRLLAPAIVCLAACRLAAPGAPAAAPEIIVLDVGQGESVLLRQGSRAVLVDGGGWRFGDIGGRVVLPVLAELGVRRLEAVVLSHPDLDHCGGLLDIVGYLPVGEIWTAPGWTATRCARQLVSKPGLPVRVLWAGESAVVGDWQLLALHPRAGDRRGRNDRSLVLAASAAGHCVLLTGDVEAGGERQLIVALAEMASGCDILKVPHHGSSSSTSVALLEALSPRLALISAGVHNRYGHPSAETLDRLTRRGIRVLRTDRHGMIRLTLHRSGPIHIGLPGSPRLGAAAER